MMLRSTATARHARARLRHDLQHSYQQLHLPFLCPVFAARLESVRSSSYLTRSSEARPRPRLRRSSITRHTNHPRIAGFATADAPSIAYLDDIPFEGLSVHHQQPHSQPTWNDSSNRAPWQRDAKNIVILPIQPPPVFNVRPAPHQPFTSNLMELQTNLYACLRVGRFDRAQALARRISYVYVSEAPEVVDAHEHYLSALLERLEESPSKQLYKDMQRWFELDIKGKGTPLTVLMLAMMVKGALLVHEGNRLARTLRRYFHYADAANIRDEVNASNLFSQSDYVTIVRMQENRYNLVPEIVSEQESALQIAQRPETVRAPSQPLESSLSAIEDVPHIRETEQKGGSLQSLKASLQPLRDWRGNILEAAHAPEADLESLQRKLEEGVADATLEKWRSESALQKDMRVKGQISSATSIGTLSYQWIKDMAPLLQEEVQLGERSEDGEVESASEAVTADRLLMAPFLRMGEPEKLCTVAVVHFLRTVAVGGMQETSKDIKLSYMVKGIGNAIVQEIKFEDFTHSLSKKRKLSLLRRRDLAKLLRKNQLASKQANLDQSGEADVGNVHQNIPTEITSTTAVKLGATFLSWILKVARIPVTKTDQKTKETITHWQPAATHGAKWDRGRKSMIVKVNLELLKRLHKEPAISMISKTLPMLVEPKPWEQLDEGGYLQTKLNAVRFKDPSRSQEAHVKLASKRGDMKRVYAALDSLGAVPWTINQPLFRVMSEIWNTGEELTGFAPADYKPEIPPKPHENNPEAYRKWRDEVNLINNQIYSYHSQRCYQNLQMETAKSYLGLKFYTPHSADFRGRAYPIPPYLNHMGSDLVRGLFLFANGRKLGETGLSWLKIHLANTFGFDKESLREREAFTMQHISDIYDSVTNPTKGNKWWMSAEDPWQCLAACIELKSALESEVPSEYISHLPIQQDGTCNGLQHYAALGGDEIGAKQVNLAPGDRPADVYSAVADLVREQIKLDAEKGNEHGKFLQSRITRKVVKQPVMTNVYGVTHYGAREQVLKRLTESIPLTDLPTDITYSSAAGYIAKNIFQALAKMFEGASAIQTWLGECGGAISQAVTPEQIQRIKLRQEGRYVEKPYLREKLQNSVTRKNATPSTNLVDCQFKSTIVWTTPLGMPVVQPYRESKSYSIMTSMAELYFHDSTAADPVSKRRQLQGFPPNFIHSLDATHMMLSALKSQEVGLTFASVHDSFWTHACDIPVMNRILRDAFVQMHAEDVIGRLREEFMARYKGCLQIVYVSGDSPVGRRIIELRKQQGRQPLKPKFTSDKVTAGQIEELCEEFNRQEMLKSDDPEERKKAREMITPNSLYDQDTEGTLARRRDTFHVRSFAESSNLQADAKQVEDANLEKAELSSNALEKDIFGSAMGDEFDEHDQDATEIVMNETSKSDIGSTRAEPSESEPAPQKKSGAKRKRPNVYFWSPLAFPEAPAKGSFNVADLKDSKYFFS